MMKKWKRLLCVCAAVTFLTACKGSTLNETNFSEPLENAGMHVGDSIGTELNISSINQWKVAYDQDGSEVQFIECGDETGAKNFFKTQVDTFKQITGKGASGNSYYASQDGFFYYAALVDDKVVLATGKSKNWDTIRGILDEMPQVP
jgi:hypothetical protein